MKLIRSVAGVAIRLSSERFGHIANWHPKMADQQDRILETLASPDYVQEGDNESLDCGKVLPQNAVVSKVVRGGVSGAKRPGWLCRDRVFHQPSRIVEEDHMEVVKVFEKKTCLSIGNTMTMPTRCTWFRQAEGRDRP